MKIRLAFFELLYANRQISLETVFIKDDYVMNMYNEITHV